MKKLLFIALITWPLFTQATSFEPGFWSFMPSGEFAKDKIKGHRTTSLPAPIVSAITVKRGTSADISGDAGFLNLDVALPAAAGDKLGEVGFYFRVVRGKQPDAIFPDVPITGSVIDKKIHFFFVWLDGPPSRQKPLDLEVEVVAVNKRIQSGKPTQFRVVDKRG